MKKLIITVFTLSLIACNKKENVDLIVTNAKVYTVDNNFSKAEAFAVVDGKFKAIGNSTDILKKYESKQVIDAKGKAITPGLIDAHCHFLNLGVQQQKVNLVGTKSFDEVIKRIQTFQKEKKVSYITGRGWDQNDWEIKEYPTKEKLDQLFPNTPIAIRRIDGHAMLVNQKAIDLAGITTKTKITGGEFLKKDGKLTGVLIDNAMSFIKAPYANRKEKIQALKDAEKMCFKLGLTTVDDAGLGRKDIELIDSLQKSGDLQMRMYIMVSNSKENLDYYLNRGIIKTDRLNVRSVKVYADGALGSRGASLKEPYHDKHNHYGLMVNSYENLKNVAERIVQTDYQMNTHAIGDSANYVMLQTYNSVLKNQKDRRWRIEHAQVIDSKDFKMFKNVLPSVQPTHATSDMYWASERLGEKRVKGAYAFKDLLQQYGKIALGTDFPIERVNPMYTFYAATARKDLKGFPEKGYQMENALSRENTLRGMTIWAAYSNFEETEKGSIEKGKLADFVIFEEDIMEIELNKIPKVKISNTFLNGKKVY